MRTAIFPGSFDPFTLGHMDILRSALKMFDKVIVAVGYNSAKSGFFTPDRRNAGYCDRPPARQLRLATDQ